jgi:hypothetical protein
MVSTGMESAEEHVEGQAARLKKRLLVYSRQLLRLRSSCLNSAASVLKLSSIGVWDTVI